MSKLSAARLSAIGFLVFAAAIIVEIIGGATNYPTVPPGAVLAFAVALLIFLKEGKRWVSAVAALLSIWLLIGGIASLSSWEELLMHTSTVVVVGAIIQLAALMLAVVSSSVAALKVFRKESR